MTPLNYEELVSAFHDSLINTLRHSGAAEEYLAMWVPDEDPVTSILNMVEAALAVGKEAMAVQVSRKTLPAESVARLGDRVRALGEMKSEDAGEDVILRFAGLQQPSPPPAPSSGLPAGARSPGAKPAGAGRPGAVEEGAHPDWSQRELNPAFAESVRRAAEELRCEGVLTETGALLLLTAERDGGKLSVLVDPATHGITAARHTKIAKPELRGTLETMCQIAPGHTVQEVSDHVGILASFQLMGRQAQRAVQGIQLPANSGKAFTGAVELFRDIRAQYAQATGHDSVENESAAHPGENWQQRNPQEKTALLEEIIAQFEREKSLPEGSTLLDAIEKDPSGREVRIVVAFTEAIAPQQKPALLRNLEKKLKTEVDPTLQIHMNILKDDNKIRRL